MFTIMMINFGMWRISKTRKIALTHIERKTLIAERTRPSAIAVTSIGYGACSTQTSRSANRCNDASLPYQSYIITMPLNFY
jgi:hypothetical protein